MELLRVLFCAEPGPNAAQAGAELGRFWVGGVSVWRKMHILAGES